MTTKKLILILALFAAWFAILFSLFGHTGYFVNSSLEKYLAYLEQVEVERQLSVQSLQNRLDTVSTGAYLDDLALSLGYNRQGDVVYYFDQPDTIENANSYQQTAEAPEIWHGIDTWILALAALALALLTGGLGIYLYYRFERTEKKEARRVAKVKKEYEDLDW